MHSGVGLTSVHSVLVVTDTSAEHISQCVLGAHICWWTRVDSVTMATFQCAYAPTCFDRVSLFSCVHSDFSTCMLWMGSDAGTCVTTVM